LIDLRVNFVHQVVLLVATEVESLPLVPRQEQGTVALLLEWMHQQEEPVLEV
jgi:hypothetical protein